MSEHTQKCQASSGVVCSCDRSEALLRELCEGLQTVRNTLGDQHDSTPYSLMLKNIDDLLRRTKSSIEKGA